MQIILQKDFPQLGFTGEKVMVKNGFARNFLIPKGFAIEINKRNEKFVKNRLKSIEAKKLELKAQAEELASKLEAENFEFKLKVGEKGKSFGSLTARNIYDAIVAKGYELDRNQVILSEPIKFVGDFNVKVKLHSELVIEMPIKVIAEKMKKSEIKKLEAEQAKADAPAEMEDNSSEGEEGKSDEEE